MHKISSELYDNVFILSGRENSVPGDNLIKQKIDLISSSDNEKMILKHSQPSLSYRIIMWFRNYFIKHDPEEIPREIELEYMGQSLSLQSEELSAQLQEQLAPVISSPLKLKGKTGLFLGAGVLASVTTGTLAYRHYTANKPETLADDFPIQSAQREPAINHRSINQNIENFLPYARVSRHTQHYNNFHIRKSYTVPDSHHNRSQNLIDLLQQENILKNDMLVRNIKKEILISSVAEYIFNNAEGMLEQQVSREKRVATSILADNQLYGGRENEVINLNFSRAVIRHWLFHIILDMSPGEYVANKVREDSYPDYFTISSLRILLSLKYLFQEELLNHSDIPGNQLGAVNTLWDFYLENEVPMLKLSRKKTDSILLNSQDFADLYTGSVFLDSEGYLTQYSLAEVKKVGESLWQIALSEDININTLGFYLFPSLVITASDGRKEFNSPVNILENYVQYRKKVMDIQQDIMRMYNRYTSAANNWLSKGKLADKIISSCPAAELPALNYALSQFASLEKKHEEAKQFYLNGITKPCRDAPDNLQDEYEKLTKSVADSFFEIDKMLSWLAISKANKNELDFIFSPDSKIKKVQFSMRTNRPAGIVHGIGVITDFEVFLKNTDLFSVCLNNSERIYALKRLTEGSLSYQLIRVDYNIRNYIDNGLLDYSRFSSNYRVKEGKVIDSDTFIFKINPINPPVIQESDKYQAIIDYLAKGHSDDLYHSLYQQGNDKSDIQNIWQYVKHLIPFYDCVEAVVDGDAVQAVPACLMDIISMIPVSGQAASIGGKFTISLLKGINKGGVALGRSTIKNSGTVLLRDIRLPKVSEWAALSKNTLRAVDPGFELVTRGGKVLSKKLDSFLNKQKDGHLLAVKISSFHSLEKPPLTSNTYTHARFPDSSVNIPVKKIATEQGNDIYTLVDPDTGELFGKYYNVRGNKQLKPVSAEIYKQQARQPIYHMDQNNENDLVEQNHGPLIDITHIPAQMNFLPSSFYIPLEMHLTGLPYLQPGFYRHLADDFNQIAVEIKNFVTMSYHQNDVFYCGFNQNIETIPVAFSQLRHDFQQYKNEVLLAKSYVNSLYHEFVKYTRTNIFGKLCFQSRGNRIEAYLSKVLQLNTIADTNIVSVIKQEAMERLFFHTQRIKDYLEYEINNIYFVSSHTEAHPYIHRASCPMGFVHKQDDFRRVIIMVDNYQASPILSTQVHLTTLHEVSHYSGTLDFQIAPSTSLVGDASEFMETFHDGILGVNGESVDIKDTFIDSYRHEHPDIDINESHIRELLKRDPVLRANAFMENADFLARMIADLGSRTPYNRDVRGRMKRTAITSLKEMTFLISKLVIGDTKSLTLKTAATP